MNREREKGLESKRKRWGRGCVDRIELLFPRKEEMILGCRVFAVAIFVTSRRRALVFRFGVATYFLFYLILMWARIIMGFLMGLAISPNMVYFLYIN